MRTTKARSSLIIALAFSAFVAAAQQQPSIIPQPAQLEWRQGRFLLNNETKLVFPEGREKDVPALAVLVRHLRTSISLDLVRVGETAIPSSNYIRMRLLELPMLGNEGYMLDITSRHIEIGAQTAAGMLYGLETLLQLFPPDVYRKTLVNRLNWSVRCVHIVDTPRFVWRGMHLDVSRHFFQRNLSCATSTFWRSTNEYLPLASDRRSGLADRDQKIPEAYGGGRMAGRS